MKHTVINASDRKEDFIPEGSIPFKNLIPLTEIIADSLGISSPSKACEKEYNSLIEKLHNEFDILLNVSKEELLHNTSARIAQGILNVRKGRVKLIPGYDEVYGKIEIMKTEMSEQSSQLTLF